MEMRAVSRTYLDFIAKDPLVEKNTFIGAKPDRSFPPSLPEVQHLLPEPFLDTPDGVDAVRMYWKAAEIGFRNIQRVHPGNGFIAPYIDSAFNSCIFMWDTCFILQWARYMHRAVNLMGTLDCFYAKMEPDGFICREIQEWDGQPRFSRFDPGSTGPNLLAYTEWLHFLNTHDRARLARVFHPILAYHRWTRKWRTWPDGSYWTCGLGSGMDNVPRTLLGDSPWIDHSHSAWVDATAQAALSARTLAMMARELGPGFGDMPEVAELEAEAEALGDYLRDRMWSEELGFFCDRRLGVVAAKEGKKAATPAAGGGSGGEADAPADAAPVEAAEGAPSELSDVMHVGAYWALVAGLVSPDRLDRFLAHLDDPATFNRPVRVPSLAASHPAYENRGGYWLGGVWPPTTYMVLRGLTSAGRHDLAADIAANYHSALLACFRATGTIWENMAPEEPREGDPAKPDFVGWGGLGPISIFLEYVLGLRADVPRGELVWDIRTTAENGCMRFPFGEGGILHLQCAKRGALDEEPAVFVRSTVRLRLMLQWGKAANAEGGVAPSPPRPAGASEPLFQRTLEVEPNMTVGEAEAPPVYVPTHRLRELPGLGERPMASPKAPAFKLRLGPGAAAEGAASGGGGGGGGAPSSRGSPGPSPLRTTTSGMGR